MKNQAGQVLILALFVVGLVLVNTLLIIGGSQIFFQNTSYTIQADQALHLAEAGIDKAVAALNATGGAYLGEAETVLGDGSYSVTITSPNPGTKIIESIGYIPSKVNPKAKRSIKITASKGVGVDFNYAVQVGEGGLEMSNDSIVNGSIYSNGNISLNNNAKINGDAYVAGGTAPVADQQSDCVSFNCTDYIFGKNVNGEDRLDVAQSFKPAVTNVINKVALKLKKIGSPPDTIVRLMKDSSGQPDKNNVLTSAVLTANLVTDQYGFVEIAFTSSPTLSADTPYWIVLDTSSNGSNYWSWSADSIQAYTRGEAKWSSNWQAKNPTWTLISADLGFKTFMGGAITSIVGTNGVLIGGDAHANTLQNLTISKGAYYQTAQNITAATYHPNSPDPITKTMPVSEANIAAWKQAAQDAGIYTGDISSCRATLGPGKYIGNVTFSNNCTVVIRDPIWITDNLVLNNGVTLKLDTSYGSSSGVIVVDGTIGLSNNSKLYGSGVGGSFLMALSTYDSRASGTHAIDVANSGNEGILYAPVGIIDIANNNRLNEVTAWKIELENNVVVSYDQGLASAFFSSGPTGAYSLIKGTYQLK